MNLTRSECPFHDHLAEVSKRQGLFPRGVRTNYFKEPGRRINGEWERVRKDFQMVKACAQPCMRGTIPLLEKREAVSV